ncbi:hypothetical protein [Nitrobacter hamburgensis]|uniref:hypothetical protein n=1 Tax=Nitrobacter hamburgensis TaxID=912 RepID=UPI00059C70D1|nr:hypothetical protein [Nitrobacter hamburgensis]
MTNAEILARAILDIELVIADHLQPCRPPDPQRALEEILTILNQARAVEVAERVQAGYVGPRPVK